MPDVTIGRIVHYMLSQEDAMAINGRRRPVNGGVLDRMVRNWPQGAQAHVGNTTKGGDVLPMIVTHVLVVPPDTLVNGQVFLDGSDTLWVSEVSQGETPGQWHWPPLK